MHPMAARALLAMQLLPEQREKLRKYERTLPRYLQGSEICQMFKLKPTAAIEMDTETLERLYRLWDQKVLWKVNKIEEKAHNERCMQTPSGQWCKCRSKADEVHEWEDWALENFGRAEEELSWNIPVEVLNRISLAQARS